MAKRVCGTCGNTQGPFSRIFVGFRKTGVWLYTCPVPLKDADGKPIPEATRKAVAAACNNRREKRSATA